MACLTWVGPLRWESPKRSFETTPSLVQLKCRDERRQGTYFRQTWRQRTAPLESRNATSCTVLPGSSVPQTSPLREVIRLWLLGGYRAARVTSTRAIDPDGGMPPSISPDGNPSRNPQRSHVIGPDFWHGQQRPSLF